MTDTLQYLKSSSNGNFFLLAGPCVIENEKMALDIAARIVPVCSRLDIPYAFKGSYRKANRSRVDSFTGIGDEKALKILQKVGREFDVPVVTDIHEAAEAEVAQSMSTYSRSRRFSAVRPICWLLQHAQAR